METTPRVTNSIFSSKEIETLYNEVLLYYENDDIDFSGYNLNRNPFLNQLEEEKGFELQNSMENAETNTLDTFYYTDSFGKIKSLFFHLRNAFAHNRIFRRTGERTIKIEDTDGRRQTMSATISSFEKLIEIIQEIKKNYNNENNNS